MSQIKFTRQATKDLARFEKFLNEVAPNKTAQAINTILKKIKTLAKNPRIGKLENSLTIEELRSLFIPYGQNGYIALYSFDEENNAILIENIKHTRELRIIF